MWSVLQSDVTSLGADGRAAHAREVEKSAEHVQEKRLQFEKARQAVQEQALDAAKVWRCTEACTRAMREATLPVHLRKRSFQQ